MCLNVGIYIIITKNIRYLIWNWGVWRFFHDTYLTIEVQGIRCTNHLQDSCPLTDVNPHFPAPGCRYYFKINSWWPIMTSSTHGPAASYCDVTMGHCSHGYLWTHDVEVGASWRDCDNLFVYFTYHSRTPVFQHGASLVILIEHLPMFFFIMMISACFDNCLWLLRQRPTWIHWCVIFIKATVCEIGNLPDTYMERQGFSNIACVRLLCEKTVLKEICWMAGADVCKNRNVKSCILRFDYCNDLIIVFNRNIQSLKKPFCCVVQHLT